jgi:hypothetical protein
MQRRRQVRQQVLAASQVAAVAPSELRLGPQAESRPEVPVESRPGTPAQPRAGQYRVAQAARQPAGLLA